MIRRFRLEVDGISRHDVQRQLEAAALALIDFDGGNREDWEITDDVSSRSEDGTYNGRVVMKLKGVS